MLKGLWLIIILFLACGPTLFASVPLTATQAAVAGWEGQKATLKGEEPALKDAYDESVRKNEPEAEQKRKLDAWMKNKSDQNLIQQKIDEANNSMNNVTRGDPPKGGEAKPAGGQGGNGSPKKEEPSNSKGATPPPPTTPPKEEKSEPKKPDTKETQTLKLDDVKQPVAAADKAITDSSSSSNSGSSGGTPKNAQVSLAETERKIGDERLARELANVNDARDSMNQANAARTQALTQSLKGAEKPAEAAPKLKIADKIQMASNTPVAHPAPRTVVRSAGAPAEHTAFMAASTSPVSRLFYNAKPTGQLEEEVPTPKAKKVKTVSSANRSPASTSSRGVTSQAFEGISNRAAEEASIRYLQENSGLAAGSTRKK